MFYTNRMLIGLGIIFGVQLFDGVQSVFDQQFKNESYEFTRGKHKCSFVLMLGQLSIFLAQKSAYSGVCFLTLFATSPRLGISGFRHLVVLRSEITSIQVSLYCGANSWEGKFCFSRICCALGWMLLKQSRTRPTRRDNSAFRYQTLPDIVPEDLSVLNVAIDCIDGDRDEGSYF